jgi:hypothetical protein
VKEKSKKFVALQMGLIYINCLICHPTGCLNIEWINLLEQIGGILHFRPSSKAPSP